MFGYVVNYDLDHVPYAAFDRDRSAASSELLAALDGSGVFQRVANLERAADVKTMIDERRALLVVQIDQDFERRLRSGQSADVQVIADGRNSNTANTALNYVGTVVECIQCAMVGRARGRRAAGTGEHPRLVQWEPCDPLEYHPGLDRHARAAGDAPDDGDVHRPRKGAGHF